MPATPRNAIDRRISNRSDRQSIQQLVFYLRLPFFLNLVRVYFAYKNVDRNVRGVDVLPFFFFSLSSQAREDLATTSVSLLIFFRFVIFKFPPFFYI